MKKLLVIVSFLLLFVGVANATQANNTSVTKLYVATFDRAPDSAGLDYWVNDSGLSLENIAMSFFEQPETKALYPDGFDDYDFILAIYKNLFKRIPDSAGSDYWQGELSTGAISKSVFILAVVNGAKGDDATILENKTQVGLIFAQSGINNIGTSRDVMGNVTSNKQTIADSFNKINNIQIDGDGNIINISSNDTYIINHNAISNYYYINDNGEVESSTDDSSSGKEPTVKPSEEPTVKPSEEPTVKPSEEPIVKPSEEPIVKPSEKPIVSNFTISEHGEGLGKVLVVVSVSTVDKLTRADVTCGIGTTYRYSESKSISLYTGKTSMILENENWSNNRVYCETDIRTNDATADVKEASIDMSPQKIAIPNSVFFEESTGLMWQDDSDAKSIKKRWITQDNYDIKNYNNTSGDTATTYCNNLSLDGYHNWRLPTRDELKELYNKKSNLNNLASSFYWSSTNSSSGTSRAWGFAFDDGGYGSYVKGNSYFVRCVRAEL